MNTSSRHIGIVGAGGLGGPLAILLSKRVELVLDIWDPDRVELSNLQRQIHFRPSDIGAPKATRLAERISAQLGDAARVSGHDSAITASSVDDDLAPCDLVIDASDSFATKFLVNDWLCARGRPGLIGACQGYGGHVIHLRGGEHPCYRCLFEKTPEDESSTSCAMAGVLSPVVGAVAAAMATSTLALLAGEPLPYALIWDDLRDLAPPRAIELRRRPTCSCATRTPASRV